MVETSKQIHSVQIFGFVLASKVHTTLILKHSVGIAKIENFDISSSSYKMSQTFLFYYSNVVDCFSSACFVNRAESNFPVIWVVKWFFLLNWPWLKATTLDVLTPQDKWREQTAFTWLESGEKKWKPTTGTVKETSFCWNKIWRLRGLLKVQNAFRFERNNRAIYHRDMQSVSRLILRLVRIDFRNLLNKWSIWPGDGSVSLALIPP